MSRRLQAEQYQSKGADRVHKAALDSPHFISDTIPRTQAIRRIINPGTPAQAWPCTGPCSADLLGGPHPGVALLDECRRSKVAANQHPPPAAGHDTAAVAHHRSSRGRQPRHPAWPRAPCPDLPPAHSDGGVNELGCTAHSPTASTSRSTRRASLARQVEQHLGHHQCRYHSHGLRQGAAWARRLAHAEADQLDAHQERTAPANWAIAAYHPVPGRRPHLRGRDRYANSITQFFHVLHVITNWRDQTPHDLRPGRRFGPAPGRLPRAAHERQRRRWSPGRRARHALAPLADGDASRRETPPCDRHIQTREGAAR